MLKEGWKKYWVLKEKKKFVIYVFSQVVLSEKEL